MPFVVTSIVPQDATYQLSWEQINAEIKLNKTLVGARRTKSTMTRWCSVENEPLFDRTAHGYVRDKLSSYLNKYKDLFENVSDLNSKYKKYYVPKRSGHGYRQICAPEEDLKEAQNELVSLLRTFMPNSNHASAYAYVEGRSNVDMARAHQRNESKWILHLDFSNFFGSITYEFALSTLEKIYPFDAILRDEEIGSLLKNAIKIGFLDGVLPQGSAMSPMFTNILMIPFDHHYKNRIAEPRKLVYTRYADDMYFSGKYLFDWKTVESEVIEAIKKMNAPLKLNTEKTHFGSTSGRSYICGVMLNKDNELTLGRKKQRQLKSAAYNFMRDLSENKTWNQEDSQILNGNLEYLKTVNKPYVSNMVERLNKSFKSDFMDRLHKACSGKPVTI